MLARFASLLFIVAAFFSLSACSGSRKIAPLQSNSNWLQDGMIAFSRPAPNVSPAMPISMLAFFPVRTSQVGSWLSIESQRGAVSLMDGDKTVSSVHAEGTIGLAPGSYQILHKQRSALWYADDNYFKARKLPIPAQNDKSRYRRGALGDFALFIGNNAPVPLHSGPIWSPEIGGMRLNDDDLSRIYYQLPVGAAVEVK